MNKIQQKIIKAELTNMFGHFEAAERTANTALTHSLQQTGSI